MASIDLKRPELILSQVCVKGILATMCIIVVSFPFEPYIVFCYDYFLMLKNERKYNYKNILKWMFAEVYIGLYNLSVYM